MSLFDDFFTPIEIRNRDELQRIAAELDAGPSPLEVQRRAEAKIERLELLVKTLAELLLAKGVVTKTEISVMMTQVDLEDGVEDGRLRPRVKRNAPKCRHCRRHINPKRTSCVYCGEAIAGDGDPYRDGHEPAKPVRTAKCTRCDETVPEDDTYFTGSGLVCEACYDPATDG